MYRYGCSYPIPFSGVEIVLIEVSGGRFPYLYLLCFITCVNTSDGVVGTVRWTTLESAGTRDWRERWRERCRQRRARKSYRQHSVVERKSYDLPSSVRPVETLQVRSTLRIPGVGERIVSVSPIVPEGVCRSGETDVLTK